MLVIFLTKEKLPYKHLRDRRNFLSKKKKKTKPMLNT